MKIKITLFDSRRDKRAREIIHVTPQRELKLGHAAGALSREAAEQRTVVAHGDNRGKPNG